MNVALVENGRVVLGIVSAPALGEFFYGFRDRAFKTAIDDVSLENVRELKLRNRFFPNRSLRSPWCFEAFRTSNRQPRNSSERFRERKFRSVRASSFCESRMDLPTTIRGLSPCTSGTSPRAMAFSRRVETSIVSEPFPRSNTVRKASFLRLSRPIEAVKTRFLGRDLTKILFFANIVSTF